MTSGIIKVGQSPERSLVDRVGQGSPVKRSTNIQNRPLRYLYDLRRVIWGKRHRLRLVPAGSSFIWEEQADPNARSCSLCCLSA